MTNQEIIQFIKSNDPARIDSFISNLVDKAKKLDNETNFLSLAMLILFFIFYLINSNIKSSVQLGPINVSDISIVKLFIPLVLSFVVLRFVIIRAHVAEIKKFMRLLTKEHFKYDNSKIDILYTDDISRIILPFSIYDEIGKLQLKSKPGCFSIFLFLPLFLVALFPYLLIFICIYPDLTSYSFIDSFTKLILFMTIWITAISMFYFFKNMQIAYKEAQTEK